MRHVRMTAVGLVAAACALGAAAIPASAHQFTAAIVGKTISPAEPGKTRGHAVGNQVFKLGPFIITCKKAVARGTVTGPASNTFYTEIRYGGCETELIPAGQTKFRIHPPVHFLTPVDIEYHVNGFVETGAESESEVNILNPGAVSIAVHGTGCKITWVPQTLPSKAIKKPEEQYTAATYSLSSVSTEGKRLKQFPSGFQQRLVIANEFKKLETEVEEEKACEGGEPTEFKTGNYKGMLEEELVSGNLGVE